MRNFSLKLAGETGVRLFSALFIFVLARNVGAASFGLYSTAFAFASLFGILIDLGTNPIITRDIARDPAGRDKLLGSATFLKTIAAIAALVSIDQLGRWFDIARDHRWLVDGLGVVVAGYNLIDYFAALLTGKEEMGWEAFVKAACRAVIALAGIAAIYATHALSPVVSVMATASLASLALGAAVVGSRFGGFHWRFDAQVLRKLMGSSLPLLGSVVFWIFYDNQDILLLHHFRRPERDIGLFWSASKVIDVCKVAPALLAGAFFPTMARFSAVRESFLQISRTLLGYTLLVVPLVVAALYGAAPRLEVALYGPDFAQAAPLLQRLLLAYAAIFINYICTQILIAKDHEKKLLAGAALACLANLGFTWWLIPIQGTMGVCNALIMSEMLYLAFQIRLVVLAVPALFNPFRTTFG
ncbi:MAG TPA: oligosaccharide flippase family protein [Elusimicrobiota bacterium]|nr:oligosaccharide flippase family protein [Elusimicrobiota bacterium]